MIGRFRNQTSSIDLGPEAIVEAVYTQQDVTDVDYAVMGTPRLRDFGGRYQTNYKVVVPLDAEIDEVDLPPFVFDLPEQPELDGALMALTKLYDVFRVEDLNLLTGQEVPLMWHNGYPSPELNRLRRERAEGGAE
jgi:hypothetical protein